MQRVDKCLGIMIGLRAVVVKDELPCHLMVSSLARLVTNG
jgi:hypothetical protein